MCQGMSERDSQVCVRGCQIEIVKYVSVGVIGCVRACKLATCLGVYKLYTP